MKYLFFILIASLVSQENIFFVKSSPGSRSKLNRYKTVQIGKSPFFIVYSNQKPGDLDILGQNRRYRLNLWHLEKIRAYPAKTYSEGNKDLPIAIIDSGADLNNQDHQERFWINSQEDINNNGKLDAGDLNGIDDDNNGYIDDVIGYDFVDTFNENLNGDFKIADPLPQDDFSNSGHGTLISSLLYSIVPKSPQMILRAADTHGYLEEDDIAKALIYAQENGAKIINMSFGEANESKFLKEIISYLYKKNIILVAATGNDGKPSVNYPAAFPEVIAVGNSNEFDERNGNSNYGYNMDLVAPGTNIVMEGLDKKNFTVSGTSFSAPMVSAAAAMVIDKFKFQTPQEVRQQILRFTDDVMIDGKDNETGSGRLNLFKTMTENSQTVLDIYIGNKNHFQNEIIPLIVNARAGNISSLSFTIYKDENIILQKTFENSFLNNDTIAFFDCSAHSEGSYQIELKAMDFNRKDLYFYQDFYIDRKSPEIKIKRFGPLLNKESLDYYLEYDSNDELNISLVQKNAPEFTLSRQFLRRNFIVINNDLINNDTITIRARDRSGNIYDQKLSIEAVNNPFYSEQITNSSFKLLNSPSLVSDIETDLNQNGLKEVYLSRRLDNSLVDTLFIFEESGSSYQLIKKLAFNSFIRDYRFYNNKHYFSASYAFKSQVFQFDSQFNINDFIEKDNVGLIDKFINLNSSLYLSNRSFNSYTLLDLSLNNSSIELKNFSKNPGFLGIPNLQIDANRVSYADNNGNILLFTRELQNAFTLKGSYNSGVHNLLLDSNNLLHIGQELQVSGDNAYNKRRRFINRFNINNKTKIDSLMIMDFNGDNSDSYLKKIKINNSDFYLVNISGYLYLVDSLLKPYSALGQSAFFTASAKHNQIIHSTRDETVLLRFQNSKEFKINYVKHSMINNKSYSIKIFTKNLFDTILVYQSINNENYNLIQKNTSTDFMVNVSPMNSYSFQYRLKKANTLSQIYRSRTFHLDQLPRLKNYNFYENRYLHLYFNKQITLNHSEHFLYAGKQIKTFYQQKPDLVVLNLNAVRPSETFIIKSIKDKAGQLMGDSSFVLNLLPKSVEAEIEKYQFINKNQIEIHFNKSLVAEKNLMVQSEKNPVSSFLKNTNKLDILFTNPLYHGKNYQIKISSDNFNKNFSFVYNHGVGKEIIVFPNPLNFKKHKNLSITNVEKNARVRIFSITAKTIFDRTLQEKKDVYHIDFEKEIGYLPGSGLYFYLIETNGKIKKGRITFIH